MLYNRLNNSRVKYGISVDLTPVYWLIFNASWVHIRVTWEEGNSTEELPPSDWPVGVSVGNWLD